MLHSRFASILSIILSNSIDAPSGVIIYLQKGWLQPVINSVVPDARHTVSREGSLSVSACFSIDV